jgi:serine/threonine-protein kinase
MSRPDGEGGSGDPGEGAKTAEGAPAADTGHRLDSANRRLGLVLRGKYRLEGVLGIGGMSVVYRAIHRNQAEFAIKMLLPEYGANDELRARFLREGYAANSVKHPGAVRVVDDDIAEDGTAFLVLELLHGLACDELCATHGGRLPLDAVCAIGLQALEVLHAAHVNGIIHRDVKPANLFLLRSGDLKVLDFGIARVRETLTTGTHTTGSGVLLGTPAFMAPEQAMGKASDVDARADIFSLGATLFSLVTGLTVHEGDSGRELLVKLVTRPTRSLLEVMPELPTDIADVIDRALDVDREERWASAGAMREALAQASQPLWEQRSPRVVLATLGGSMVPSSRPSAKTFSDPQELRRSPPIQAEPTLRAQERPGGAEGASKPPSETARGVARERSATPPRPRRSLLAILAVMALGAALSVLAAIWVLRPDGSSVPRPDGSSQTASATGEPTAALATETGTPPSAVPSAAGPIPSLLVDGAPSAASGSEGGKTLDAARTAVLPSDIGRATKSREAPSREHEAPPASAAAAQPPSSAPVPPAASQRAASPGCNPPFYYDSSGNRVFKKECL